MQALEHDPVQFKLQLENELKDVESKLEKRTKKLQDRLREVAELQQSLQLPKKNTSVSQVSVPEHLESTNVISSNILQEENNNNEFESNTTFLNQLKSDGTLQANDRIELEESRQRYKILLDEERQACTQAKRKAKQLEAELIQVKKRLNQEMTSSSQKDQKLQELQRKFPVLLSELERTESRSNQMIKDKDDLQQRRC